MIQDKKKKGPVFLGKRADRLILEIPSLAFRQFREGLNSLGREAAANLFSFSFSFFSPPEPLLLGPVCFAPLSAWLEVGAAGGGGQKYPHRCA